MIEVRPATAADVADFYGAPPATMRAWVALVDGKLAGIAGIAYGGLTSERTTPEAFSKIRPELEPYLRSMTLLRGIRRVAQMIRSTRPAPVAIASRDYPGSSALMRRLGARSIGHCEAGEVFQWPN